MDCQFCGGTVVETGDARGRIFHICVDCGRGDEGYVP